MPPAISIITVYYNNPDDIFRLYQSMKKHLASISYEWIIADNASDRDLSAEIHGATYLRLESNLGFGGGSNRAAEKAAAPVLFFVNPDCQFIDASISELLKTLKDSAVAGPRVLYPDRSVQLSFGPFLSITGEARQKLLMRYEQSKTVQNWLRNKERFHPDFVSGCAMMIRAEVFRKLNGFDERFFLYNEDVDLCKRVNDLGLKVTYEPSAEIIHVKNTSTSRDPAKTRAEFRKSQIYYYQKHNGFVQNSLLKFYLSARSK